MKKTVLILLSLLLFTGILSGCTKKEEVSLSDLSEYSIVYPADWSEWKMEDVNVLKNTIEKISGKEIKLVPDTEEPEGKEIILASSSRKTKYDEKIAAFDNTMCYLIGTDGDNIVLGGQNFYSDMRAIYDFVNNYLGYDDLEDKYSDMKKSIEGEKVTLWEKPVFHISGSNFSCDPYTEAWQIKDFADCNFNMLMILYQYYNNEKPVKNVAKWCARFGIELLYYPRTDKNELVIVLPDEEGFIDNPAIWGFYVVDEPRKEEDCLKYAEVLKNSKEKYKDTGWKFFINTCTDSAEDDWLKYFTDSDVFSFDLYINNFADRNTPIASIWDKYRALSRNLDQDYFIYIDAFNLKNRGGNTTKMFRSHMYLALVFDADAIEYFQYGDASKNYSAEGPWDNGSLINYDYTKNSYWYDAQTANAEVMKIAEILDNYEYLGAFSDRFPNDPFKKLDNPYDFSDVVTSIKTSNDCSYLVGCYEAKDEQSYAMILMNCDKLDDYVYGEGELIDEANIKILYDGDEMYMVNIPDRVKFTVNGSKVTCYRNAEPTVLEADDNGTYAVRCENGDCLLLIIEK